MRRRYFYVVEDETCPHCNGDGGVWVLDDISGQRVQRECRCCGGKGFIEQKVDLADALGYVKQYFG